jgi:L-alanine-DL-glutamate epimerase-like enolase superfamily enzyme
MKIATIRASVHGIPVTIPLLGKPIEHRKVVFCEVETDDGYLGSGLTGHFLPFAVAVALEREFLPVVKGLDPRDTEAIHERIWWTLNPRAMTGVVSSALSCLDIALWDIHGKMVGRSVAQLLGGARNRAPTYITFGFSQYDRDQLVQAARDQVDAGNRRLKMVVAATPGGWKEDAERLFSRLQRPLIQADERAVERYASNLSDAEWALIEPFMPARKLLGRPRETGLRAVLDAILYIARTAGNGGCNWRPL